MDKDGHAHESASSWAKRLLVIDRDSTWRSEMAAALKDIAPIVIDSDEYAYDCNSIDKQTCEPFDLVVLGCAKVSHDEWRLIQSIINCKQHLLVLSSWLTRDMMRELFRAGVDDVAEKPYTQPSMLETVEEAISNIAFAGGHEFVARGKA